MRDLLPERLPVTLQLAAAGLAPTAAFFYILTALIVDILYVYADPRIRH